MAIQLTQRQGELNASKIQWMSNFGDGRIECRANTGTCTFSGVSKALRILQ